MRVLRIGFLLLLVGAPVAAASARSSPGCSVATAPKLPAPLTITTAAGSFRVGRDGLVCRASREEQAVPEGVGGWPYTGIWTKAVRGHVLIGRGRRTEWRSSGIVPHAATVDGVVVRGHAIAFCTYWRVSRLYLARPGGRVRLLATREFPLGWTRDGLYVGRDSDGAVLLRSGRGARRIVGARYRTTAYDPGAHALYFLRHGRLLRANGTRTHTLASLARFGVRSGRNVQLLVLGRLVALEDSSRLVVLRPDGSLFASTRLRLRAHSSDQLSDEPVASPSGRGVAFAILRPDRRIETQVIERGVETVYVLRPGARAAVPVYSNRLRFNVCGHGATLAWHGSWLLYSVGEGPAALIDTAGGRPIRLTSVVRRLPGFSGVEESGPLRLAWA